MDLTEKPKVISSRRSKSKLETILKAIALILTISVFLKGIIDIDGTYDTWGYHLPFAARMWSIVPAEQFINMEERFAGFPLLGEFFQGFFWLITQRVQGANLVGFFSLVLYAYFLKKYFQVAYYLTAIALLGVPLIQAHAVNSYVDLIANVFLAMMIMMAYVLYRRELPSLRDWLVIFLAGVGASNSKPQLEPLVFVVLCFIAIRILWLRWRLSNRKQLSTWLLKAVPIAFLASLLIFATPIKNIALYGNPFYPVRIEIGGRVLNHALPMYSDAPGYLADAPKAQRWLYSILDINSSAYWNHDRYSEDPDRNRMGGFFGAYVVFQILLLAYLIIRNPNRNTKLAGIVVLVMSFVAANFPQSHELRYFMYWMMVLISLNLYLVTHYRDSLVKPTRIGLMCLIALIIVGIKTNFVYLKPSFNTLSVFKDKHINRDIIAQIEPGDRICLPNQYPYSFGYTPWFHPELDYTYTIRSGFRDSCAKSEKVL